MTRDTEYATTDLDLEAAVPFDRLHRELEGKCCVLHYTRGDNGNWHSIVEASIDSDYRTRSAEMDIAAIIAVIRDLSPEAKAELSACTCGSSILDFIVGIPGDSATLCRARPSELLPTPTVPWP